MTPAEKRAAYFERKGAGKCPRPGCTNPPPCELVLCIAHSIINAGLAWALRRMKRKDKR